MTNDEKIAEIMLDGTSKYEAELLLKNGGYESSLLMDNGAHIQHYKQRLASVKAI